MFFYITFCNKPEYLSNTDIHNLTLNNSDIQSEYLSKAWGIWYLMIDTRNKKMKFGINQKCFLVFLLCEPDLSACTYALCEIILPAWLPHPPSDSLLSNLPYRSTLDLIDLNLWSHTAWTFFLYHTILRFLWRFFSFVHYMCKQSLFIKYMESTEKKNFSEKNLSNFSKWIFLNTFGGKIYFLKICNKIYVMEKSITNKICSSICRIKYFHYF